MMGLRLLKLLFKKKNAIVAFPKPYAQPRGVLSGSQEGKSGPHLRGWLPPL